jgi:glycosyltransferase involved in cell wall biosynthesis
VGYLSALTASLRHNWSLLSDYSQMKRRRVLLFIDSLVRGGAQRQLVELALHLDVVRFEPTVLIYCNIQQLRSELDGARIPVVLIEKNRKLDLSFLVRLTSFLRASKPDVIHSYLNTSNLWARIAGKLAGIEFIITSERAGDTGSSSVRTALERILQHTSRFIVANSESAKADYTGKVCVNPERVCVIYNGVDVRKFSPPDGEQLAAHRRSFRLAEDQFVVTLPGRLTVQKNHLCLVKAVAALGHRKDKIRVLFVGNEIDARLKQRVIAEIEARSLDAKFIFGGVQNDMATIYALSNAIVLPSLWESFPNVLLEAMAAGKPVIASDIADNRRIVQHGINGYLFARNDEKELAKHLGDLIDKDRQSLERMGQAGRTLVLEQYSIEKMVQSYEKIYALALERK